MAASRFLHAADLHLGAPLQSLGERVPTELHAEVLARAARAFDRLVQVAIDDDVAFVVLAGDIFDTAERDPGAQRRVLLGLRHLADAGIAVFMVHGNHDPLADRYRTSDLLPPGVTVFPADRVETAGLTLSNGVDVTVAGISYATAAESRNLVGLFAAVRGDLVVGALHTNVGGTPGHGDYAPCTVADLEAGPVHYWALGHVHQRTVRETPKGWWAYPGNLQGRSTKATECGPKGVLVVDVEGGGAVLTPRFVPCDEVRFHRLVVDLGEADDQQVARDVVLGALEGLDDGGVLPLVRVEVGGASPVAQELRKSFETFAADIVAEAADRLPAGGAVVSVRNSCTPAVDRVAARTRQTLLGAVLRRLDEQAGALDAVRRAEIEDLLVQTLGADT